MSNPWSDIYKDIRKPYLEGLDPVGKEDGDVNNDGKKDSSDSYLMKRRKAIAKAMGKEDKMKKVKNEHHQKDADGNPIEHGDGTPSNVDEMISLTKGDYGSRNTVGSVYNTAKKKNFDKNIYKPGAGLGANFLPRVDHYEPAKVNKPNYSNWREDFIWDDNVEEAAKGKKLDVKENGVKNKIEINPDDGLKEAKVDQGKSESDKMNNRNQRLFGNRRNSKGGFTSMDDTEKRRYNTKAGRGVKLRGQKDKRPMNYHKRDSDASLKATFKDIGASTKSFEKSKREKNKLPYRTEEKKKLSEVKPLIPRVKTTKKDVRDMSRPAGTAKIDYRNLYMGDDKDDKKKKGVKGIAKELDKAVAMHKGQAKRLRAAGVSEGFYQKRYAGVGKGYETVGKNKRMDKSNKRSGDSKAQYRELHKGEK